MAPKTSPSPSQKATVAFNPVIKPLKTVPNSHPKIHTIMLIISISKALSNTVSKTIMVCAIGYIVTKRKTSNLIIPQMVKIIFSKPVKNVSEEKIPKKLVQVAPISHIWRMALSIKGIFKNIDINIETTTVGKSMDTLKVKFLKPSVA